MSESTVSAHLVDIVTLLKAMGNERRFEILHYLSEEEKAVGELEELVGLSQSALSQHLARLRRDGMVKTRRDAQKIYYSLSDPRVSHLLTCLVSMHGVDTDSDNVVVGGESVTVLRTA
ncbi:ArsR/SmtB family transcription factor [Hwanghaeella sp.]|uniref:ArsR/SmtB family transcription factor n=1 Tax=Hwanghaeella sp. TaxID=2605943 RepID=UPI003CCC44A3